MKLSTIIVAVLPLVAPAFADSSSSASASTVTPDSTASSGTDDDYNYETVYVTRMVYQDIHVYVDESGVPITTATSELTVTDTDYPDLTSFFSSSTVFNSHTPTVVITGHSGVSTDASESTTHHH